MKSAIRCLPFVGHQLRWRAATRIEFLTVPIGFEAFDDLGDLVGTGRHDGVVTGFGEVLVGPVQRLGEGELAVDHHRLLVRQIERRGDRLDYVHSGETTEAT